MELGAFAPLFLTGIVVLFLLRVSYRLIAPGETKGDAFGQLLQIREMKRAGHRRPNKPSMSAGSGYYAYPYFVIWVLSFVPERFLKPVDRYFSGIMDVLFAVVFLYLVHLGILTYNGALLALAIFIATPQFMRPDLSHGLGLSSRKPGLLFTTVGLLSFFHWVNGGSLLSFALAVLFGGAMIMTSKFSLQAYLFILLPTTAFVTPTALLLIVLSLTVAIIGSRGRYLRILSGHLRHVYDYALNKQYKRFDHSPPNPVAFVRRLVGAETTRERLRLFKNNKRLRPFGDSPFMTAVVVAALLVGPEGLSLPPGYGVWIAASIGAFMVTALPHMLFLGQAGRYLEYGLVPSVVLIANAWAQLGPFYHAFVGLLIALGLMIEIFYLHLFRTYLVSPKRQRAFEDLIDELESVEDGTVLTQPTYTSRAIAWETDSTVVVFLGGNGNTTEESTQELNTLYPNSYGFATDDVEWIRDTFDPTWVVFDTFKIEELGLETNELAPPSTAPIYENEGFRLFRFESVYSSYKN